MSGIVAKLKDVKVTALQEQSMPSYAKSRKSEISYSAPLISNIRQILTGLQGFDSMAREIIQNADDAGAKSIKFNINDRALVVWNDAEFINCGLTSDECSWAADESSTLGKRKACDFHAISKVGSGNKYNQPGLIGRFGIGFVSVYQLTDQPIIRSGNIELRLDPLSEKAKVSTIDALDGSEIDIPWALDDHSPIREALNASAFSLESLESLQNDLIITAENCLLFLNHLQNIEILRNGERVSFVEKAEEGENHVRLSFDKKPKPENWFVIHLDAEEAARPLKKKFVAIERLDRQTTIQVAFRLDDDERHNGLIFAYLPTEQESPIPCHINADFFPEQTRKSLVLSGEQHERYWNEMLLGYIAKEIAARLASLKNVLGPKGLWRLIDKAFQNKNEQHFGMFWKEISREAREAEIFWTSSEQWTLWSECSILQPSYGIKHEVALGEVGIVTINSSMRPFKSSMTEIGLLELSFEKLLKSLKSWEAASLDKESKVDFSKLNNIITPIWRVLDDFLENLTNAKIKTNPNIRVINVRELNLRTQIEELTNLKIAPCVDGKLAKFTDLKKLPRQANAKEVFRYFSDLPLVSKKFAKYPQLFSHIPEFDFEDLLLELASLVEDEETAKSFLTQEIKLVRGFYDFLTNYPRDKEKDYSVAVASTPFLAGHSRFLAPELAVLPGGFDDPIGRFDTLNLEFFGEEAQKFLKEVLKVKTLTLETYINEHLPEILQHNISNEQYISLLDVFVSKKDLLKKNDIRETLAALPLVKTKDGSMRPAVECYSKTAALTEILGNDDIFWIDESIFDDTRIELYLGFLRSLGMREKPSLTHALARMKVIVENPPVEETRKAISKIFAFLAEIYESESLAKNEDEFVDEISQMRDMDWLPAKKEGKLDTDWWYAPHELFQPHRADGFASQVPVLSLTSKSGVQKREFFEFLKMPAEPDTSIVVDHIEEFIERGLQPDRLTYLILNERFKKDDDTSCIERLKDKRCIYAPKKRKFFGTDRFFGASHIWPGTVLKHRNGCVHIKSCLSFSVSPKNHLPKLT